MGSYFSVLYNTHFASVTLGNDYLKSCGFIQISESLNKDIKPNEITKGMKIYDYENSFYMNLAAPDFAKLKMFFDKLYTDTPQESVMLYTDQSKSQYNQQGIGVKTLSISCIDKEKKRLVDKDGNPVVGIFCNTKYINGTNPKFIMYRCSAEDTLVLKSWVEFSITTFFGLCGFMYELVPVSTGKTISAITAEMKQKAQQQRAQNNQQNTNNYNGATFAEPSFPTDNASQYQKRPQTIQFPPDDAFKF